MSDEELIKNIADHMDEDWKAAIERLSQDHSTDDLAEIRRRINALFEAKPYEILKHPDCDDDKMYYLPADSVAAQQAKRYTKYLNMATFLNGGGKLTDEQMTEYRELEAEFGAGEAELTLEGAVTVLNERNHNGPFTRADSAKWEIVKLGLGGRFAWLQQCAGDNHYLNEFEAIAVAEKYLREEK